MPRYHFHLRDGRDHRDEVGTDLPTIDHARRMALTYLSDTLREAAAQPAVHQDWHIEVTGEAGHVLFSVATNLATASHPR